MADDRPDPDLYTRDFYAWTQTQAQALRARGGGANILDYDRLAEEIEDVGGAQRNTVRSALRNIIIHLLELETSQANAPRLHWRSEVMNFRVDAEAALTPTIRRDMEGELETIHLKAARLAQAKLLAYEPDARIDSTRRWPLAALLGETDDPLVAMFPDIASD